MIVDYRRHVSWAGLALLWPPSVLAGVLSFGDAMRAITGLSFVGLALLSTLSGFTALFYRIDREYKRTGKPLPNWIIFVAAHMTGSWTAGTLAFFSGEGSGLAGWVTAASIIIASLGGAGLLELVVERKLGVRLDQDSPKDRQ